MPSSDEQQSDATTRVLENAAEIACQAINEKIRARAMAARRAIQNPEGYIVARSRSRILKLLALHEPVEEIVSLLFAVLPESIGVSEKSLLAAIRRMVAREQKTSATRSTSTTSASPVSARVQVPANPDAGTLAELNNAPPASTMHTGSTSSATGVDENKNSVVPQTVAAKTAAACSDEQYRNRSPSWADGRYELECLKRQERESTGDYNWRVWHTPPPWADEFPRKPNETDIKYARRCWGEGSPEERAEKQRNLPPTAR